MQILFALLFVFGVGNQLVEFLKSLHDALRILCGEVGVHLPVALFCRLKRRSGKIQQSTARLLSRTAQHLAHTFQAGGRGITAPLIDAFLQICRLFVIGAFLLQGLVDNVDIRFVWTKLVNSGLRLFVCFGL